MNLAVAVLIMMIFMVSEIAAESSLLINEIMAANASTLADEDGDYSDWLELYNAGQTILDLGQYALSDEADERLKWKLPPILLAPQNLLLVFASDKDRHECIPYWQALIKVGDVWRYRTGTSEPGVGWHRTDFDDSAWPSGPSGFGYGDDDDNTVLPNGTLSVYIRHTFSVEDLELVRALRLHVDYDDGFIAYLNGVEVARSNLSGEFPPYNQSSDTYTEPKICYGGQPAVFGLDSLVYLLREDANVLAIQVHNSGGGSSDLTVIPFLSAGLIGRPASHVSPDAILNLNPVYPHTNFKIKADGETIFLSNRQGQSLDSVNAGGLLPDMSRGRFPDGTSDWLYYTEASPNASNSSDGASQLGRKVIFSLEPGFYGQAQTLSLTSESGEVAIYYTLDGNEPSEDTPVYTVPLQIRQTTVVRARGIGDGQIAGPIETNTYIIGRQPDLAVISLTTPPANLWDVDSGIYVMGPNASSELPYYGANFWQDWEKPVHVEFFEPNGVQGFEIEAGLQIFGGWSRACAQKPLAIFARGKYGAGEIEYPLFPDLAIDKFESFLLRNSANDWQYTLFRDALMQSLVEESAIDLQAYRPAVVFLNGAYWGIQNIREKLNEHYVASHHSVDPAKIDLLESRNSPLAGSALAYDEFYSFMENNDLRSAENYNYIRDQMDIDNFIDYELAEIYFDNEDWPGNNLKYWRERSDNGRWRWILFDTDFGFGLYDVNKYQNNTLEFATAVNGPDWPNPPWSTLILRKLLENDDFKVRFINRAADFLNVNFNPTQVNRQIDYFYNLLVREMPYHFERWRSDLGWSDLNTWQYQIGLLRVFANNRQSYFIMDLNEKFGLRGRAAATIRNAPAAGRIRLNRIYLENEEWTGYYFLDVPVEIEALPRPGFRFTGWTGSFTSTTNPLTVIPSQAWNLRAEYIPDSTAETIIINEINYHPSTNFDPGEWVELLNNADHAINLADWIFKDSSAGNGFTIPKGVVLQPGEFLVLCHDTSLFRDCFPEAGKISGNFGFNLSNSGESIRIYDQFGDLIDAVDYTDEMPWPTLPDGSGPTLMLIDPDSDNSDPVCWSSSAGHGSPGAANVLAEVETSSDVDLPDCRLDTVYPNPFNISCLIPVKVEASCQVEITIYDLQGARLATLFSGRLNPGHYSYRWIPRTDLSSGIYLCQVTVNTRHSEARKVLLLK